MRDLSRTLLLMCVIILLSACGQAQIDPSATPEPSATPIPTSTPVPTPITVESLTSDEPAFVRFINSAPNSATLNAYIWFSNIDTNLAYTQFTESTLVDAGQYVLKILPSGSRQDDPALLETELTVKGGEAILVLIVEKENQLTLTIRPEKQEPLNAGESIITAINATTDGSTATLRDGENEITVALNTGDQVTTPILGTENDPQIAFQIGSGNVNFDEELRERQHYTLIAAGSAAQPAIISFRTTAPSRVAVRALDASVEIPAIDVYLGETLLNANAEYGRPTERKSFASGEYTVLVYTAGADRSVVEPLLNRVMRLDNGENIALILLGDSNALNLISYSESLTATAPDSTRLALLNTLPDAETIIVQTSSGSIGGEQRIVYGQQPTELNVEAGRYSFVMAALRDLNPAETIEIAENLLLEAGVSYLYFVTGRMDNQPIILSEVVNTDNSLTGDDSPDAVARANPAQVRFINAVAAQNLDFFSSGNPLFAGVGYGEGSELLEVSERTLILEIRAAGGETALAQAEGTFEAGSRSTVIAYVSADSTPQLLIVSDDALTFDGNSPYLRLINVSGYEETKLGLAFTEPGPTPPPPATDGEDTTGQGDAGPLTLPYGLQKLVSDVAAASASSRILMPVGVFDLNVINSQRNEIVVTAAAQSLEAGAHTDVVAYQITEGGAFQAFVIQYPRLA